MRVKFLHDRKLTDGRSVMKGDVLTVSADDGSAFVRNGVAEAINKPKEVNKDG